jgi:hypothetical protein
VTFWGDPEENCQKCVNTRENELRRALAIDWMPSGGVACSIVVLATSSSRSFLLLKVSQKCSQLIHMHSCFCLASGLETRNRFQNRQEKNEQKMNFIFHHEQKFS